MKYIFADIQPFPSLNYYRLKQVDINGKFSYSKIVLIKFDQDIYISSIYPTPATLMIHVSAVSAVSGKGNWMIIDANGKIVNTTDLNVNKGYNTFDIDVTSYARGVYILKLVIGNEIVSEGWIKK